ncbi:MAG TPA: biotin-dependent carboxyltransferase family protein, partial [Euryarchaeota archaeon]|nr:biotin-dependent carboxyltransferase family protein [Euryarchaeota archaeon]
MIEILDPGIYSTIQDLGRWGFQKYGVPVSGVMDEVSARLANILVGNTENAALIEFYVRGPTIKFHTSTYFVVGGDAILSLNNKEIMSWTRYRANVGDILKISRLRSGAYGYVAFFGGINTESILGSRATYVRAKMGKKLEAGDILPIGTNFLRYKSPRLNYIPESLWPKYSNKAEVRVILGPNEDHFTENGIKTFLSSWYTVSLESDRMGYRLEGPRIEHSNLGPDIITDAVPLGSIQVPGNGLPIIMLADRQTTGGYAKIGVVIRVD